KVAPVAEAAGREAAEQQVARYPARVAGCEGKDRKAEKVHLALHARHASRQREDEGANQVGYEHGLAQQDVRQGIQTSFHTLVCRMRPPADAPNLSPSRPLRPPMPPSSAVRDVGALERELRAAVKGEVRFDHKARALYATDASTYRIPPI